MAAFALPAEQPGRPAAKARPNESATAIARAVTQRAKTAALEVASDYDRGRLLGQIGAAEARLGDLNAAVETANRAYPHSLATLTSIGEQLATSHDASEAKSIGERLKEGGSSTVLASIVDLQAEKGDIVAALRTSEGIRSPEVRGSALKIVAQRQAAKGDYSGARRTLAMAAAADPNERSAGDDVELLIAESQIARGEDRAAHETLERVPAEDRSLAMLSGATRLLERAQTASAAAWLEEALREIPPASSAFTRYFAIPLQVKLGQKEAATRTAESLSPQLGPKGYVAIAVTCAEARDLPGVNAAIDALRAAPSPGGADKRLADFSTKLFLLDVTAALIDHGEIEAGSRLLSSVEQDLDDIARMSVEPKAEWQRAVAKALQGAFEEARMRALEMSSVAKAERHTALRSVALLQSMTGGALSAQAWAVALPNAEDRAHALLGIAQALLGIDDGKIPYNVLYIH
jgi:tetratricopeptide (TPR) repeat protein